MFNPCSISGFYLLALCLALHGTAHACTIPVFRYALDRWPADPFRLEISADDAKDEAISKFTRNFGTASALNLELARIPAGPSRLLRPHAEETAAAPVWTGTLTPTALAQLTNSPARIEIVRRILAGDSAVWILVESADRAANEDAAKTLENRLRYLEQVAQVPAIDPTDPTSKLGPGPKLGVKFSLLRIGAPAASTARSDASSQRAALEAGAPPDESAFLAMLAGPRSGLAATSEPWIGAVFGRGRVIGAWPAKGFGDEQIEEISLFLLGACSCQVKKLNPGWDLLLHADWDEQLRAMGFPKSDDSTTAKPGNRNSSLKPETISISGSDPSVIATTTRSEAVALGGGALLLLIVGGLAWRNLQTSS